MLVNRRAHKVDCLAQNAINRLAFCAVGFGNGKVNNIIEYNTKFDVRHIKASRRRILLRLRFHRA